jgi:hypothetical protein
MSPAPTAAPPRHHVIKMSHWGAAMMGAYNTRNRPTSLQPASGTTAAHAAVHVGTQSGAAALRITSPHPCTPRCGCCTATATLSHCSRANTQCWQRTAGSLQRPAAAATTRAGPLAWEQGGGITSPGLMPSLAATRTITSTPTSRQSVRPKSMRVLHARTQQAVPPRLC